MELQLHILSQIPSKFAELYLTSLLLLFGLCPWKGGRNTHCNWRWSSAHLSSKGDSIIRHGHYLTVTFLTFPLTQVMILTSDACDEMVILHIADFKNRLDQM